MPAPDVSRVTHGPAQFLLTGAEVGHTVGGISCTISPQTRMRTVDQFGTSELAVIHTGDQVRMSVPWAEWTTAVLAEILESGRDQTSLASGSAYIGVGRSAGYVYTTQEARIIPRLSAETQKRIVMFRTTPIGEITVNHNTDDDRIFETEFACLADETRTDGELVGRIQI